MHDAGTGGDGLGDVSGVLDATVGDDGDAALAGGAVGLGDGGDLGHAGSGDHAGGADGAGPDADLDGVGSGVDEGHCALVGGDVAGEEVDVGEAALALADGFEDAGAVAVGGVDGEGVDAVASMSSAARSRKSPVAPMAPATRRRPCESLEALGYLSFFWMSLTVMRPLSS